MSMNSSIKDKVWIVIFLGVAAMFIALYYKSEYPGTYIELISFSLTMGRTFIAAGLVALLLRLPSVLNDVNNSAINLLKNNSYLEKLSVEELTQLRADATKNAYIKTANAVNPSLNNLDSKIANLFLEPYFNFYSVKVSCKLLDENFIEKRIVTHFSFKNPNKEECNTLEHFNSRVIQDFIKDYKKEDLRVLESLEVMKDDDLVFFDYTPYYNLKFSTYKEEAVTYSVVSRLRCKNEKKNLNFNDKLQMKIIEKRITPKSDNVYLNRITSPTEKFSIHYSFVDRNVDLIGNGFGTFQNTKDGGINITKDSNSIHIESSRWLLTGNGIIIVHNNT